VDDIQELKTAVAVLQAQMNIIRDIGIFIAVLAPLLLVLIFLFTIWH
jgi:cell division protein FtsX